MLQLLAVHYFVVLFGVNMFMVVKAAIFTVIVASNAINLSISANSLIAELVDFSSQELSDRETAFAIGPCLSFEGLCIVLINGPSQKPKQPDQQHSKSDTLPLATAEVQLVCLKFVPRGMSNFVATRAILKVIQVLLAKEQIVKFVLEQGIRTTDEVKLDLGIRVAAADVVGLGL